MSNFKWGLEMGIEDFLYESQEMKANVVPVLGDMIVVTVSGG